MTDLIKRLESAEQGSRELSLLVYEALTRPEDRQKYQAHTRVTTDLDAAVALVERVLPGWDWERARKGQIMFIRIIGPSFPDVCTPWIHAETAPLALCIALLKALEAKEAP